MASLPFPPLDHIVPRRAHLDVVDVIGDCDELPPDLARAVLCGVGIEVERYLRTGCGRTQNAAKVPSGARAPGKVPVIGLASVASQRPLTDQEPSALSTTARSSMSSYGSNCPKTMPPFWSRAWA